MYKVSVISLVKAFKLAIFNFMNNSEKRTSLNSSN